MFNTWGIGRAGTNAGVLVLVAPRDRQIRIEVGTGLQRVLTNDIAAGHRRRPRSAVAAWWFPFSGWGIPGWLLLGGWTWLVFSAAWKPPRTVQFGTPLETPAPSPSSEATSASPDDEPWFLRRYTRGDPFAHEPDERPRRRRDRDWDDSDRSSGSGGFGGGSSSGGGATGKW